MQFKREIKKRAALVRLSMRQAHMLPLVTLGFIGFLSVTVGGCLCIGNLFEGFFKKPAFVMPYAALFFISALFSACSGVSLGCVNGEGNPAKCTCIYRAYLLFCTKSVFILIAGPLLLCSFLPFFSLISLCMIFYLEILIHREIRSVRDDSFFLTAVYLIWLTYLILCVLGIMILN